MTVPVHGLPPLLHAGLEVALVPPALKQSRWHVVEHASDAGQDSQLVQLSGLRSIGAADEAVGKTMLARIDDLPADLVLHDLDALMGREVIDEVHGSLGVITQVMQGAAQDVWEIEGPYGEVLIPAVDAFIIELPQQGAVRVRVPEGTVAEKDGQDNAL